jgi:hypothetical protein
MLQTPYYSPMIAHGFRMLFLLKRFMDSIPFLIAPTHDQLVGIFKQATLSPSPLHFAVCTSSLRLFSAAVTLWSSYIVAGEHTHSQRSDHSAKG